MYKKVEGSPKMTRNEAMERYPNNYVLMQKDNGNDLFDPVGVILYVGDDGDELFSLQVKLPVPHGVVYEGVNVQRYSLGGVIVARNQV